MADFEWFRSFVAVYRSGSVSGAAAVRHLSQPAISQHIAALEAEVGAPLFERHPRGMVPTKRGNELYSQVAPAVDDRAHLERWLLVQPWIAYGPELPIIRRFWRRGFGHRPTLEPVLVVPDLRTIAELVACGYGLSVLPDYLCAGGVRSGRLRILWDPPESVTNQLFVAIKRSDREDELLMRAVDALLGLEGSGPHRGSP